MERWHYNEVIYKSQLELLNLYNIVILANENTLDHLPWVKGCEEYKHKLTYRVVQLTSHSWLEEIQREKFDFMLAKPGGFTNKYKQLYDERVLILTKVYGYRIFPTMDEILLYENKRFLSFWLEANNIPHPVTKVFYDMTEAKQYIEKVQHPLVAKLNIGASGHGVSILKNRKDSNEYLNRIFGKGIISKTGPKLGKGSLLKRIIRKLTHFKELKERLSTYNAIANNPQTGFCILQEYIHHAYEWRVVRIGDSFYAHKKIVNGEKASGSLIKEYSNPPLSLLSFVKDITDRFKFYSQAIDIFERGENEYLVNEMQCIFGQSDPYQMMVDNKPGRYIFSTGKWLFEEGIFNANECFNERLEYVISLLGIADSK